MQMFLRWLNMFDFLSFKYHFLIFGNIFCFSSSRRWAAIGCQGTLFTGQFPGIGTSSILAGLQMCKMQTQGPPTNQGGCGGRRLGSAGSGGNCARRSMGEGGSPSRL